MADLTPEQIQQVKDRVDALTNSLNAASVTVTEFGTKAKKAMQDATKEADRLADATGTYGKTAREIQMTLEAQERTHQNINDQLDQEIERLTNIAQSHQVDNSAEINALKQKKKLNNDLFGIQKKVVNNQKEGVKAAEDTLEALGLMKKNQVGILGILTKTKEQQKAFGARIKESIKSGEALAGAFARLAESAMQMSLLGMKGGSIFGIDFPGIVGAIKESLVLPAELYRTFGDMEKYSEMIIQSRSELAKFGVTEKEAGTALAQLASTIPEFNMASVAAQKEMTKTTAALGKMGFETGTLVKSQESLIKTLGMAPMEAARYTKSLAGLSKEMKVGNKFFQDMQSSMEQLAAFTKDKAIKVFETMTTRAHAMGLSIGQLWKTTEGFETFAGASAKVAEFNIALGGPYLNTLKMMKAAHNDPIQVIEQLQSGLRASGKTLKDMSPAMVKYMASTIGVSKVELKRIMSSKQALKDWADQQKKSEERQKKLNEMITKAQDVFQALSAAIRDAFFENGDFIESMKGMIFGVRDFIKENKYLIDAFIMFVKPPGALLVLFAAGVVKITSALFMLNLQMRATSGGTMGLGSALSRVFSGGGMSGTMAGIGKLTASLGGAALMAGALGTSLHSAFAGKTKKERRKGKYGAWGAAAGAAAGIGLGLAGAALTATGVGATIGVPMMLMAGGLGAVGGKFAGEAMAEDVPAIKGATAIMTPSGPIGLSPGDVVSAGRSGGSMDKGFKSLAATQNKTNELLQALLNKDANIYMDGDKVTKKINSKNNKWEAYGDHGNPL